MYSTANRGQNAFLTCASTAVAYLRHSGVRATDLAGPENAITTCVIQLALAAPGIVETVLAGVQPAPPPLMELMPPAPIGSRYCGSEYESMLRKLQEVGIVPPDRSPLD